jgi:hypothetical protein
MSHRTWLVLNEQRCKLQLRRIWSRFFAGFDVFLSPKHCSAHSAEQGRLTYRCTDRGASYEDRKTIDVASLEALNGGSVPPPGWE